MAEQRCQHCGEGGEPGLRVVGGPPPGRLCPACSEVHRMLEEAGRRVVIAQEEIAQAVDGLELGAAPVEEGGALRRPLERLGLVRIRWRLARAALSRAEEDWERRRGLAFRPPVCPNCQGGQGAQR